MCGSGIGYFHLPVQKRRRRKPASPFCFPSKETNYKCLSIFPSTLNVLWVCLILIMKQRANDRSSGQHRPRFDKDGSCVTEKHRPAPPLSFGKHRTSFPTDMSSRSPATSRVDSRLSIANPESDYSNYLKQQQQQLHRPTTPQEMIRPSSPSLQAEVRRHSHANYSTQLPPSSSDETSQISSRSSSSGSSTNSTSSSHEPTPETARYTLPDNLVRLPPPRQPAHRSKLSKQYTPSDTEDSDDEPLGSSAQAQRRSRYMSGQPTELNSTRATESLRAISKRDMSQTATISSVAGSSTDTASLNSATKKLSFAKRVSRLFSGGSKSSKKSTSLDSSSATTPATSDASGPSIEIISDPGRQELQPPSGPSHQRSPSSPDARKYVSYNYSGDTLAAGVSGYQKRNSLIVESHNRKTRDSGFEDMEGQGHRRYSSATQLSIPTSVARQRSSSSAARGDTLYIDQQHHNQFLHPAAAQHRTQSSPSLLAPRPNTAVEEQLRPRRITLADVSVRDPPPHTSTYPARRSSTPVITETLVSRIDREKSTVCFQAPAPRRDSYSRDPNLDPALSNLVQQHRRDYQVNTRLGGSGAVAQQPLNNMTIHSSPLLIDTQLANARDRDIRASTPRRDSSSSQTSNSPHFYPVNTGLATPGTPGLHPMEVNTRRYSGSYNQQQPHPYPSGHKPTFSGSHGNLPYVAATSASARQTQQQQPSPLLTPHGIPHNNQGRHRTSPKRQSSASYFAPSQQQQQAYAQSVVNISPFPSPVLGATATSMGYGHELSVAMQHQQHQQQQIQLQIQQQQLQHLQQQQQQQQLEQYYQVVSPLALLQTQQQQQQQQLEQLQQIRVHQQNVLLQQQLQHQLEQTRAAVVASTAATAKDAVPQQQQSAIINTLPMHFSLPAAPVLTTAMGMGMGMGMNPASVNMNMMGMGISPQAMVPQLMMTPQLAQQLAPQLMYSTAPIYAYQQQQAASVAAAMTPVVPAAGGSVTSETGAA
ncbi:hypothetical protein EDD21DRAFT_377879 [Dissophora ornata]|nr:hypothetical protein EDD21DRAFT_377879 [Dissophora ornata]